jgi:hypothetical protein
MKGKLLLLQNKLGFSPNSAPTRPFGLTTGPSHLVQGGGVNGEQGVPNNGGIFHPSSGEYRFGGESRGVKEEEDIPDYSGGVPYRFHQG